VYICLFVIVTNITCINVRATSFDGVFLLVPFHYIDLMCNYCFLLWLMKYLSVYLQLGLGLGSEFSRVMVTHPSGAGNRHFCNLIARIDDRINIVGLLN